MPRPAVSVVVTSDYASGTAVGWEDLRASLAALARQDFREPAEFLLVETAELATRIPADVLRVLPSLRVVSVDARAASALKNAGAQAASADIVALVDGDCRVARGWLRHLVTALREHPEAAVVSGRTTYGDETRSPA
jgi:cellulose synthase/poly-beta-1,6-N-acetylglucosamine synthase-like glycosyltransferase